jgi:hypothetical protein
VIEQQVDALGGATHLHPVFTIHEKEVFAQLQDEVFHVFQQPFVQVVLVMLRWKIQEVHHSLVL